MKKNTLFLAAASLLASLPSVHADASLFISDGTHSVTIADGSALDSSSLVGVITYNGLLDASSPWSVNVTTGISKPFLGSATSPFMDLNSVNVSSTAGGNLTIEFSDNNFGPLPPGTFTSEIGGSTFGSVSFQTYVDLGNGLFAKTTPLGNVTFDETPFSSATISERPTSGPFSMTIATTISHDANQVRPTSFNASFYDTSTQVPEPSTVSLLALGVIGGIWMASRSRKNKSA